MLDKVRQMGVEIHLPVAANTTLDQLGILKSIEDYGFLRFDSKLNAYCNSEIYPLDVIDFQCFEIVW